MTAAVNIAIFAALRFFIGASPPVVLGSSGFAGVAADIAGGKNGKDGNGIGTVGGKMDGRWAERQRELALKRYSVGNVLRLNLAVELIF